MIQFDEQIFSNELVQPPTLNISYLPNWIELLSLTSFVVSQPLAPINSTKSISSFSTIGDNSKMTFRVWYVSVLLLAVALAEQNCPGNVDSEEVGLLQSKDQQKQMPESFAESYKLFLFGPQTQKSTFFWGFSFGKKKAHTFGPRFHRNFPCKFQPVFWALRIGRRFLMLPRGQWILAWDKSLLKWLLLRLTGRVGCFFVNVICLCTLVISMLLLFIVVIVVFLVNLQFSCHLLYFVCSFIIIIMN